jgi:hypothetical protein
MQVRKKRGPYSGRADYTISTKLTFKIPITPEERLESRAYHRLKDRQSRARRMMTIEGRAFDLLKHASRRAKEKNIPFDLTLEWIEERLKVGTCERCGISFVFDRDPKFRVHRFGPSIDRHDPDKGYLMTNCSGDLPVQRSEALLLAGSARIFRRGAT